MEIMKVFYSIKPDFVLESEVIGISPRTGRPKVDNPKSVKYSVRLDVETEEKLKKYCEKKGISRMEAIRRGIHLLLEKEK